MKISKEREDPYRLPSLEVCAKRHYVNHSDVISRQCIQLMK